MKMNVKNVLSVTLASAMMLSSTAALASNVEVYNTDLSKAYTAEDVRSIDKIKEIEEELTAGNNFAKKIAGKMVDVDKYEEKMEEKYKALKDTGISESEIIAELDKANVKEEIVGELEAVPTELKVESVSAINDTIKNEAKQQLEFSINEQKDATDVKALEDAGYTVEFKYNKSESAIYGAKGLVDGTKSDSKFEYQVVVTPKEGDVISSEWKEVTLLDAAVATKVNKVELVAKGTSKVWDQKVLDGAVSIEATEFENALGETNDENAEISTPVIEKVTSSDNTIAFYANGKITVASATKAGEEVTFTVKFKDIKETKEISFETKTEQTITSIRATNQNVKAGSAEETVEFQVLDQDGEVIVNDVNEKLKVKIGEKELKHKSTTGNKLKYTTGAIAKGKTETVEVTKDDKKIGSFTVTGIDVEEAEDYKIVQTDNKNSVDLNTTDESKENELVLTVEATTQGVSAKIPSDDNKKVVAKSSDDKVVKITNDSNVTDASKDINVKGVKVGTANIQLYLVEGAKETKLGDAFEVTVKNTTEQISTLTLKEGETVEIKDSDNVDTPEALKNRIAAVVAAVNEETINNEKLEDIIESVTVVPTGSVLVKLKDQYISGNNPVELDATIIKKSPEEAIEELKNEIRKYAAITTAEDGTITAELRLETQSTELANFIVDSNIKLAKVAKVSKVELASEKTININDTIDVMKTTVGEDTLKSLVGDNVITMYGQTYTLNVKSKSAE